MLITLCDVQPDIVDAWRRYLPPKLEGSVEVLRESIIHVKVDAVTSPANSSDSWTGDWMLSIRSISARNSSNACNG